MTQQYVVDSKYRGEPEYDLVRDELVRAAQSRRLKEYKDLAKLIGLLPTGHHMAKEIGLILGAISEDEFLAGRPMLSAVAVNVSWSPGDGFYKLARRLGRLDKDGDQIAFWKAEREAVHTAWAPNSGDTV